MQVAFDVAPIVVENVPGKQSVQICGAELDVVEYEPAGQSEHPTFPFTNDPAGQIKSPNETMFPLLEPT